MVLTNDGGDRQIEISYVPKRNREMALLNFCHCHSLIFSLPSEKRVDFMSYDSTLEVKESGDYKTGQQ